MPLEDVRRFVIVSPDGFDAAGSGAGGFVLAVGEPSAEFVVALGGVDQGGDEFIVVVFCQVDFRPGRRSLFDCQIGESFVIVAGGFNILRVEEHSHLKLENLRSNALEFHSAVGVSLVNLEDLDVLKLLDIEV